MSVFTHYEHEQDWLDGIRGALHYFSGVPRDWSFDNAKSLMIERDASGEGQGDGETAIPKAALSPCWQPLSSSQDGCWSSTPPTTRSANGCQRWPTSENTVNGWGVIQKLVVHAPDAA